MNSLCICTTSYWIDIIISTCIRNVFKYKKICVKKDHFDINKCYENLLNS